MRLFDPSNGPSHSRPADRPPTGGRQVDLGDRSATRSRGGARPALRLVGDEHAGDAGPRREGDRPAARTPDRSPERAHADRTGALRGDGSRQAVSAQQNARRAVTQSNVEASIDHTLDPQDPRWLVALETAAQLEGSLLTFERRRAVLAFAQRVGVRPFDANLIIAAVQDRARRGEAFEEAMSTVALTSAPGHPPLRRSPGHDAVTTRRWWRPRLPRLLSREAMPYVLTGLIAVLAHAAAIGVVLWLMLT